MTELVLVSLTVLGIVLWTHLWWRSMCRYRRQHRRLLELHLVVATGWLAVAVAQGLTLVAGAIVVPPGGGVLGWDPWLASLSQLVIDLGRLLVRAVVVSVAIYAELRYDPAE